MSCEVLENCLNKAECHICYDYSAYLPIDKKILCKRTIAFKKAKKDKKKADKANPKSKSSIGRANKRKGGRLEREATTLLKHWGYDAEKVPLSGALGHSTSRKFSGDIQVKIGDEIHYIEVKGRQKQFDPLYNKLEKAPVLLAPEEYFIKLLDQNFDNDIRGLTNFPNYDTIKTNKTITDFFDQDDCKILLLKANHRPWLIAVRLKGSEATAKV